MVVRRWAGSSGSQLPLQVWSVRLCQDFHLTRRNASLPTLTLCLLSDNTATRMIKSDRLRVDAKRRHLNEKKKQFAVAAYRQQDYPHRLNFYEIPPTAEITLEDFEKWAIDRLRSEQLANPCILYADVTQ